MPVMNTSLRRPIRRVQVVLPSSLPPDPRVLEDGMAWLREAGLEVHPPLSRSASGLPFLAGPDLLRAQELAGALADEAFDAVWCGRGGTGSLRTLAAMDEINRFARAARSPETPNLEHGRGPRTAPHPISPPLRRHVPLVGLSDATALLLARAGGHPHGVAIHGPVVMQLPRLDEVSADAVRTWLRHPDKLPVLRADPHKVLVPGAGEGRLVAGNLSLLASCAGTPEALRDEGFILLIEEIGEPAYRIDRLMAQLWRSGGLVGARGLCLGAFMDCRPRKDVADCLQSWAQALGVPACGTFPVGHGTAAVPLAVGLRYRMSADDGVLVPLDSLSGWLDATAPDAAPATSLAHGAARPLGEG